MRASTRRGYRKIVEGDLEIMPLMNLFVALIPMLLISAVFLNVTVIDMQSPPDVTADDESGKQDNLTLAVTIRDEHYVVEGHEITKQVIPRADAGPGTRLAAALAEVAIKYPDNQDIMIISQPHTRYSDIIAVMDISREAGLPSVSLLGAN